jgi:hypothetical protein
MLRSPWVVGAAADRFLLQLVVKQRGDLAEGQRRHRELRRSGRLAARVRSQDQDFVPSFRQRLDDLSNVDGGSLRPHEWARENQVDR